MKKDRRTNSGFTLVELLVAIALMLILTGITSTVFLQAHRTYMATVARIEGFQDARFAVEQIAEDLRRMNRQPMVYNVDPLELIEPFQIELADGNGTYEARGENHTSHALVIRQLRNSGGTEQKVIVWYRLAATNTKHTSLQRFEKVVTDWKEGVDPDDGSFNVELSPDKREVVLRHASDFRLAVKPRGQAQRFFGPGPSPLPNYRWGTCLVDADGFLVIESGEDEGLTSSEAAAIQPGETIHLLTDEDGIPSGPYTISHVEDASGPKLALQGSYPEKSDIDYVLPFFPAAIRVEITFFGEKTDDTVVNTVEISN